MSIFVSPEEPKYIDIRSGRIIKTPRSFSREAAARTPTRTATRSSQVVPECTELRSIRERYQRFVKMFNLFTQQNGPGIIGTEASRCFIHFKQAFEAFVIQAKHYFNSSARAQTVRRYSPIVEFSARLLQTWAEFVITINELAEAKTRPHVHQIEFDFEQVAVDLAQISQVFVTRTYYRDVFVEATQKITRTVDRCRKRVCNGVSRELGKEDVPVLQNCVIHMSREIEDKFVASLPRTATGTPEMTRIRMHMKAVAGDIVSLIEALYYFKGRIAKLLVQMSVLHMSICGVLDRVGLEYDIQVEPLSIADDEVVDGTDRRETDGASMGTLARGLVREFGEALEVDLSGVDDPVDEIDMVQQAVMIRLSSPSGVKTEGLTRVARPRSAPKMSHRAPSRMSQMQSIPSLPHIVPDIKGQTMKVRRPRAVPPPPTSSPAASVGTPGDAE